MIEKFYNDNSPYDFMVPHQPSFLEARLNDLLKIENNNLEKQELLYLFHDWASFSTPYGFGYLCELSKKAIKSLERDEQLNGSLLSSIKSYLHHKKIQLASVSI